MSQESVPSLQEFEEKMEAFRRHFVDSLPEHLKKLGDIVRQTVADGDLSPLAEFLKEQNIDVAGGRLEEFRDFIILKRLDLKDLEPAARERLRARVNAAEDPALMSPDYRAAKDAGVIPKCRECRHFVTPPNDGSPDGDKACVSFGTKGADNACFGYTAV